MKRIKHGFDRELIGQPGHHFVPERKHAINRVKRYLDRHRVNQGTFNVSAHAMRHAVRHVLFYG